MKQHSYHSRLQVIFVWNKLEFQSTLEQIDILLSNLPQCYTGVDWNSDLPKGRLEFQFFPRESWLSNLGRVDLNSTSLQQICCRSLIFLFSSFCHDLEPFHHHWLPWQPNKFIIFFIIFPHFCVQ
jgi:hypothetical protein